MGLTDYLKDTAVAERYRKVKRFFRLTQSLYDVSSQCQLRCAGCFFFFTGDKYKVTDITDYARWRTFMESEKVRGVNFVNLAGAEPALAPEVLRACHDAIPSGTVFTNGLEKIDPALSGYRVHISVWGDPANDPIYRKRVGGKPGPDCLTAQLDNYADDPRAVFIYTFNRENIDQVDEVIGRVAEAGREITFSVYSAAVGYKSGLELDAADRARLAVKMDDLTERHRGTVLWSPYSTEVHTAAESLHDRFVCPLPRASGSRGYGVEQTFRNYRADHTYQLENDCGVPGTDCDDCRHYGAGASVVTARLNQHMASERLFRGWLDYVDTWLSAWILEYEQGLPLMPAAPVPV